MEGYIVGYASSGGCQEVFPFGWITNWQGLVILNGPLKPQATPEVKCFLLTPQHKQSFFLNQGIAETWIPFEL